MRERAEEPEFKVNAVLPIRETKTVKFRYFSFYEIYYGEYINEEPVNPPHPLYDS